MFWEENGRRYTHLRCLDCGHVRKAKELDWSEQDACPKCDGYPELYDPRRKRSSTEDAAEIEKGEE